jgi:AcrR family transcriptional regulator
MSDDRPDVAGAGMSRAMRQLWGRREDGRRGPKPAMSVRAIAVEAVALADAEGLDAVTMAALASRLGFTTMSLYRYVESRQDLLEVMVDEAVGPPPTLNRRRGWRGQIEEWAGAEAAQFFAHPWVFAVQTGAPPVGPNLVGWMEAGFAALNRTRLGPQEVASSLLTVDGYVRSNVQLALQFAVPGAAERWATQLRSVLDPDAMPTVRIVLDSGALEDGSVSTEPEESAEFGFGLGLLLDGIERIAARTQRH